MRTVAVLVWLAAAALPATAEVSVRVTGGTVDLTATAAPLSEVLDRLGRQTGMKVVYEGAAPRQLVTVSLKGRTPAEAVLSVLEGLGVNFALVADTTGARVQTLVVAGTASASAASSPSRPARPAPASRRPFGPPPGASPETVEPAFEEADDEEPMPEESAFPGLPPGAEMTDPSGVPLAPDPTAANPAAPQGPTVPPPGAGMIPTQPAPSFPASPFAPQAQPFPPVPPGAPVAPGAPPPEEGAPANPPPIQ